MRQHLWVGFGLVLLASGCGSGGSGGGGSIGPGGGPVNSPVVVNVSTGGQVVQGINITVFNPATPATPGPPNAELLGVNHGGTFSLFNTGDTISRTLPGPQMVALCGPGLSQNMTVTVAGPSDFAVSNISGSPALCQPQGGGTNVPGIQFDLTVTNPNATLGARTVILRNVPDNDITTFTGGLEVVP